MTEQASGPWARFSRIVEKASQATGMLGALAILGAALVVTEGVMVRKVLGQSTIWQIEFSVFLLMYACFVGAALAQKRKSHLNVDLVVIHLSPKAREVVLLVAAMISCLLCLVLAVYSWPMWWQAVAANEHSESLWGPALWIPYIFLPLGMTLLFLQYLVQIVDTIKEIREGTYEVEAVRTELKEVEIPPLEQGPAGEEKAHE